MPQILIVDDSVSVRKALERILKSREVDVVGRQERRGRARDPKQSLP